MWIWVKCLWKEQIYREGEREKNQQNMQTHAHIYTHRMLNVSTQNINIYALAELGMAVIAAEINVSLLLTVYFIFLWRSHFVFTDLKETHIHTYTQTHTKSIHPHIPILLNQADITLLKYYVWKCFSDYPSFVYAQVCTALVIKIA